MGKILCVFITVVLLSVALFSHGDASVKFDIVNQYEHDLSPSSFTLFCGPQELGYCDKKVLLIEIKKGERVLASVRENDVIAYGHLMQTSIEAAGHVESDASKCSLNVTLLNAVQEDSGIYTCNIIYIFHGNRLEETASANVSVTGRDLQDVVRDMLSRLTFLEKLVKFNENDTRSKLTFVEERLVNHGLDQRSQQDQINMWINTMSEFSDLSVQVRQLLDQDNTNTAAAFSAGYNARDKFRVDTTLVFREVLLNIGEYYNKNTGVFTAPRAGIYVFHLVVLYFNGGNVDVQLRVNAKDVKASVSAGDHQYYDQSSTHSVVSLNAGDEVKPVVVKFTRANYIVALDHFSTFSGYLVKAL